SSNKRLQRRPNPSPPNLDHRLAGCHGGALSHRTISGELTHPASVSHPVALLPCMRASAEKVLAGFARRQYGIATRAQLLDATLSRHQLDYLIKSRRLESPFRSVYRIAGVPSSWVQDLLAACWAGGDRGGVASHRAAAALWDLPGGEEV